MQAIVESTLYLSVTAIVILLFKRLFKKKLSAKWQVLVWAFLAVRLVLPSLPESSFSIFNAIDFTKNKASEESTVNTPLLVTEYDEQRLIYGEEVDIIPDNTAIKVQEIQNMNTPLQNKEPSFDNRDVVTETAETAPKAKNIQQKSRSINVDLIVTSVHAVGAVLLFAYFLSVYIICKRNIYKNQKVTSHELLELADECKMLVGVKRNVAFVTGGNNPMLAGIIKPVIVLPENYTRDENKNIIIHELCHLKNNDILLLWLSMIVLCLNWYNPIMWLCFFTFRRDIEVFCDERVLKYASSKREYAALLVKTALKKNSFIAGTTSLQNGEKEVERRVKHMAYFKKPNFVWTLLVVVAAVVVAVVCLTNPVGDEKKEGGKEKEEASSTLPKQFETQYPGFGYDVEQCKSLINCSDGFALNDSIQLRGEEFDYIVYEMTDSNASETSTSAEYYYNILIFYNNKLIKVIEAQEHDIKYSHNLSDVVLECDMDFDGNNDVLITTYDTYAVYLQGETCIEDGIAIENFSSLAVNVKDGIFTGVYDGSDYKSFKITDGKIEVLGEVDPVYLKNARDNYIELGKYAGVEVYPYLNEFFPHLDGDVIEYTGEFLFDEAVDFDGKVQVEKIRNTNKGILYCLTILEPGIKMTDPWKINPDCSKIYFNVTKDEIYLYESNKNQSSETPVMNLHANELSVPYEFTCDGTTSVYRYVEDATETGFYETFIFKKGKGLVEYKRGYGAGRDHVGLRMKETQPEYNSILGYLYDSTSFDYVHKERDNNVVIRYPVFIGMDEVTETIKDAAFEPYEEFRHNVPGFTMTTWDIDYEFAYISENYISIVFDGYFYTKGTAHGTNYRYAVTVDVANKKPVELNDVFNSRFTECITHENFGESVDIDLSGEPDGMDLLFNNIRQEFETERYNEDYDYFHFTNDKFHIIHYPQSSGFCFTADYESLKPYMEDHPIWHELGFEPNDYDYSEVYDKNVKVMESSKNFLLEDRTDKYYFEVNANNGENLDSGFVDKCPVFIHLDGPLYELRTSYGTFAWKSTFFDVERGTVSELFDRPFYLTNTVIARVNSNDYYDESLTNKTGMHTNIVFFDVSKDHLENIVHSVSADFLNDSTSWIIDYVDDTHISVTYYTENGSKENKKILEVPSLEEKISLYEQVKDKIFYLEEKSPNEYYCEVRSNGGQTLIYSETYIEKPTFTHIKDSWYELKGQGDLFFYTDYINTATGKKTETLLTEGFYLTGNVIAFVNRPGTYTDDGMARTGWLTEICLHDFVNNKPLTQIDAEFLSDSLMYDYSIAYVDDTHISVTYYTENGSQENKKILEVPSMTGKEISPLEKLIDNKTPADELITVAYPASDMKYASTAAFFDKYPPECVRRIDENSGYVVYKADDGGYWFARISLSDEYRQALLFPVYLHKEKSLTKDEFLSKVKGGMSHKEVEEIDEYGSYITFYMSSTTKPVSKHVTIDGYLITVNYGEVNTENHGLVESVLTDEYFTKFLLDIDKKLVTKTKSVKTSEEVLSNPTQSQSDDSTTPQKPDEIPAVNVETPLPAPPEELSLGMDESFFSDKENMTDDELGVAAETLW